MRAGGLENRFPDVDPPPWEAGTRKPRGELRTTTRPPPVYPAPCWIVNCRSSAKRPEVLRSKGRASESQRPKPSAFSRQHLAECCRLTAQRGEPPTNGCARGHRRFRRSLPWRPRKPVECRHVRRPPDLRCSPRRRRGRGDPRATADGLGSLWRPGGLWKLRFLLGGCTGSFSGTRGTD